MCVMGSIVKICSFILLLDLQRQIADWLRQNKEKFEEKDINFLFTHLKMKCLVELILSHQWVTHFLWFNLIQKRNSHVAFQGIHRKCGHIGVNDGNIFDVTGESSMTLSAGTFEEALGEKVNSTVWCKNFYPHSWWKIVSHFSNTKIIRRIYISIVKRNKSLFIKWWNKLESSFGPTCIIFW